MESDEIRCPICHKDDQIRKVSSIVIEQTQEISGGSDQTQVYIDKKGKKQYEDVYVPYSGTQMSALAKRLSSPARPDAGCNWGLIIAVALMGFAALWMGVTFISLLSSSGSVDYSFFLCCCSPIVFAGAGGILVLIVSINNHRKRVAQVEQVELPRWEKAMARWNRLYYCFRDDSIFIPHENEVAPSSEINEFIHRG